MSRILPVFLIAAQFLLARSLALNQQPQCPEATVKNVLNGMAKCSLTFLREAYQNELKNGNKKSLVMSAASVFIPLGELALYAQGDTYNQLIAPLHLQTKEEIRCAFPVVTNRLKGSENVTLNIATRVYATDVYPLNRNFLRDTRNLFDAEAQSVNFNNGLETADTINKWVASETNNRIQNIATADMFDDSTRLVLADAVYFLGYWASQFNEADTAPRDFFVDSKTTIQIPTMYKRSDFSYAENSLLDCKVLKMPYEGGDFSFVILLPNQRDGLSSIIDTLRTFEAFYDVVNSVTNQDVKVYLPRMKIESSYNLKKLMSAAGLVDIFDPKKSQLDGILEKYEPLFLSAAVQKAFVEVTEKGTEAAAANVIVGSAATASVGPVRLPKIFQADHPYIFFIMKNDIVLFSGTFTG